MEAKIIKQTDNPLLSRKEIVAQLTYEGPTPKRSDAAVRIAELTKSKPDSITVRNVLPAFGGFTAIVHASVYKSAEDKQKFDSKRFKIKGTPRQAAAKKK